MSASASQLPRFLTTSQAAEMLAVAPDKIVDWIHSGQLRGVDVATRRGSKARWRIALSDLESFIANRSISPTPKVIRRKKSGFIPKYYQ